MKEAQEFFHRIMEILDGRLAELPRKQVIHDMDRQILRRTEIKAGEVYEEVYTHLRGLASKFRTASEPAQDAEGSWYVLGERFIGGAWRQAREFYLSDMGVVPYDNGGWNETNYLRKA